MIKLSRTDWIAISAFFLTLTLIATWAIDVSVSALISNGHLSNGFFTSNPTKIYHIGLYIIILIQFANFLIYLHVIGLSFEKKSKEN